MTIFFDQSSDSQARRPGLCALLGALALVALLLTGCGSSAPVWRYGLDKVQGYPPVIQIAGERVYMQTITDDMLIALDLATGRQIWKQSFDTELGTGWQAAGERILYIQSADPLERTQIVAALDAATGQFVWRFDEMRLRDKPRILGGYLFIFDAAGKLLSLDLSDGRVMGSYPGAPEAEVGEAGADAVQMAISAEAFYLLSPAGVLRTYGVPQPTLAASINLQFEGVPAGLDVVGSRVFVRTEIKEKQWQPKLHVFDLATGQQLWEAYDVGWLREVVEAGGRGYALVSRPSYTDVKDGLLVFDLESGQHLYSVDALGVDAADRLRKYWLSPDGKLVSYTTSGELAAHDLATGDLLWRAESDSINMQDIGGQGQFVYLIGLNQPFMSVTGAIDRFEVFDLSRGRLLWRLKEHVHAAAAPDGPPRVLLARKDALALYPLAH